MNTLWINFWYECHSARIFNAKTCIGFGSTTSFNNLNIVFFKANRNIFKIKCFFFISVNFWFFFGAILHPACSFLHLGGGECVNNKLNAHWTEKKWGKDLIIGTFTCPSISRIYSKGREAPKSIQKFIETVQFNSNYEDKKNTNKFPSKYISHQI